MGLNFRRDQIRDNNITKEKIKLTGSNAVTGKDLYLDETFTTKIYDAIQEALVQSSASSGSLYLTNKPVYPNPDGENTVFIINDQFLVNTELIFVNKVLQHRNIDYEINGSVINFFSPPPANAEIRASYARGSIEVQPIVWGRNIIAEGTFPAGTEIIPTTDTYKPGFNEIKVYFNGVLQSKLLNHYEEYSTTAIRIGDYYNNSLQEETEVIIEKISSEIIQPTGMYRIILFNNFVEAGTETINLDSSYKKNNNELEVYFNGILQKINEGYLEDTPNRIKIGPLYNGQLQEGTYITVVRYFSAISKEGVINQGLNKVVLASNVYPAGTTTIPLMGTYIPNNNELNVYINGIAQFIDNDQYIENSSTSIYIPGGLEEDSFVYVERVTNEKVINGTSKPIIDETIIATAGQDTFTLTTGFYYPGSNDLKVYRNGILLDPKTGDYTEVSPTTIKLSTGVAWGTKIRLRVEAPAVSANESIQNFINDMLQNHLTGQGVPGKIAVWNTANTLTYTDVNIQNNNISTSGLIILQDGGLIITGENNTTWKLKVDANGNLTTEEV